MAVPRSRALKFTRAMHLKQGRDFARLRREGHRSVNGCLIANWQSRAPGSIPRLGVITAGRIGNAVVRSRARRLLREVFRVHQHELAQPVDLVLIARASIADKDFPQVERDYLTTLRKTGLMQACGR